MMLYRIISFIEDFSQSTMSLPPSAHSVFTKETEFCTKDGEIDPSRFVYKVFANRKVLEAIKYLMLGNPSLALSFKTKAYEVQYIVKHCTSTANYLSHMLLNLKDYRKENSAAKVPFIVIAAIMHKIADTDAMVRDLGDKIPMIQEVARFVKKYEHNQKRITEQIKDGIPLEAIKADMESSFACEEELLFYLADAMEMIEHLPKDLMKPTDVKYLQIISELAKDYNFESFSTEIDSFLFRVTESEEHEEIANLIEKKFGKGRIALEEELIKQTEQLIDHVAEGGIPRDAYEIRRRIKLPHSVSAKLDDEIKGKVDIKPGLTAAEIKKLKNAAKTKAIAKVNDILAARFIFKDRVQLKLALEKIMEKYNLTGETIISKEDGKPKYAIRAYMARKNVGKSTKKDDALDVFIKSNRINVTTKANGYESIHINLPGGFELQLRTEEMHRDAEYRKAAHGDYKRGVTEASSEDCIESIFKKQKAKYNGKMKIFVNGDSRLVKYDSKSKTIKVADLYFGCLFSNPKMQPRIVGVNDVSKSLRLSDEIKLGDRLEVVYIDLPFANLFHEVINTEVISRLATAIVNKHEYRKRGEKILVKVAAEPDIKVKAPKGFLLKEVNVVYKTPRKQIDLSIDDCLLALGAGLITENMLRVLFKAAVAKKKR